MKELADREPAAASRVAAEQASIRHNPPERGRDLPRKTRVVGEAAKERKRAHSEREGTRHPAESRLPSRARLAATRPPGQGEGSRGA